MAETKQSPILPVPHSVGSLQRRVFQTSICPSKTRAKWYHDNVDGSYPLQSLFMLMQVNSMASAKSCQAKTCWHYSAARFSGKVNSKGNSSVTFSTFPQRHSLTRGLIQLAGKALAFRKTQSYAFGSVLLHPLLGAPYSYMHPKPTAFASLMLEIICCWIFLKGPYDSLLQED